jgi:nucleoside-diphosphate-sugar epimerase
MQAVGITGAGGYIGQRLIAYLENQNWCSRILATDIKAPTVESSKLTFSNQDIREPSLIDFWKDHDVTTVGR